jgi:competence protein ComEA
MLKKILAVMVMMYAAVSFAAVDVNKATAAELDSIKGIGPAISAKILDEKKKGGNFKDWNDLVTRVNGVGEANAAKFSAEGLTVGGASFKGVAAAPTKAAEKPAAAKDAKDAKPAATTEKKADVKADAKPAAAAPAAEKKADAKPEAKADPKAEAKAKKEAEAKAKADAKQAKADEAKAKKEAAAKAKADEKAAKAAKDAKPAAKDAKTDDKKVEAKK